MRATPSIFSSATPKALITKLAVHLPPASMLWVSWPKLSSRLSTGLSENDIRKVALAAGLVDIKVCALDQDWSGLAGKGRTLVIYMGVATAEDVADKLIADGVSPAMPVAVLERGTRSGARALRSLLADLGGLMKREAIKSPAIIVVGEVVLRSDAEDRLLAFANMAETAA